MEIGLNLEQYLKLLGNIAGCIKYIRLYIKIYGLDKIDKKYQTLEDKNPY